MIAPAAIGVLAASVVGSVHCAGMCGGFACMGTVPMGTPAADTAAAHTARTARWTPTLTQLAYHGGRLAAYVALGALAGALGAQVTHAGTLAGLQRGAAVIAGALMVAWALSAIAARHGHVIGLGRAGMGAPLAWQRLLGGAMQRLQTQPPVVRAGATGLLTSLLPCGWLYVFVATAGGTGSVSSAMTTMAFFWAGTVPALLVVAVGARRLLAPLGRRLPTVQAVVVLVMGLLSMSGRLGSTHTGHVAAATMTAAPPVATPGHARADARADQHMDDHAH